MEKIFKWSGVVALVILAIVLALSGSGSKVLSGTTNYDAVDVSDGYKVDGTTIIDGSGAATLAADATFNGGDGAIVITSSNSATSSVTVGCIETYATSTATTVRLQLGTGNSISTTTSRDASAAATGGVVYWFYGTCP